MFSNLTTLWDTVKAGVQGHGPDSDSEKTEGPDSDGSVSPTSEHSSTAGKPDSPTTTTAPENPDVPAKELTPTASPNTENPVDTGDKDADEQSTNSDGHQINQQIEEVSTKAINTAKEWGNYLYSFGKAASSKVAETAKQVKDAVEEKTLLGDFSREQEKFVSEQKEKSKTQDASVPPWVGYNEEESMKTQILALSKDKRNFLRNPPAGVQFQFDYSVSAPIAAVMLQEDPNLETMRFELVPKQITEEAFWRNYFYRVSLIKQSAQLTSIAQHTGDNNSNKSQSSSRQSSTDRSTKSENASGESQEAYHRGRYACYYCEENHSDFQSLMAHLNEAHHAEHSELGIIMDPMEMVSNSKTRTESKDEDLPTSSPPDHEFASDAFQAAGLSEADIRKEMQQIGVIKDSNEDDVPEWERELQAELQEYEVVNDGNTLEDEDLEKEILKQIEAEANES